jgi:hypothetical protein
MVNIITKLGQDNQNGSLDVVVTVIRSSLMLILLGFDGFGGTTIVAFFPK